jgi:hypothetical protein
VFSMRYNLNFSTVRSLKCSTADTEVANIIRDVMKSDYAQHIVKALNTVVSLHKFGTYGALSYDLDLTIVC